MPFVLCGKVWKSYEKGEGESEGIGTGYIDLMCNGPSTWMTGALTTSRDAECNGVLLASTSASSKRGLLRSIEVSCLITLDSTLRYLLVDVCNSFLASLPINVNAAELFRRCSNLCTGYNSILFYYFALFILCPSVFLSWRERKETLCNGACNEMSWRAEKCYPLLLNGDNRGKCAIDEEGGAITSRGLRSI